MKDNTTHPENEQEVKNATSGKDEQISFEDSGNWHKVSYVAKRLSVTRRTILNLIERGELPAIAVGATWRISEAALNEFINRPQENRTKRGKKPGE